MYIQLEFQSNTHYGRNVGLHEAWAGAHFLNLDMKGISCSQHFGYCMRS
jgi:hypothetical protein